MTNNSQLLCLNFNAALMDIPPAKSRCQPNAASPAVLPNELIARILSFLTVKSLTRFRCVSKSWNTLISDPTFVKLHLNRSARNTYLALIVGQQYYSDHGGHPSVVLYPVRRLLENPVTAITDDTCYRLNDGYVIGSCNGLICLLGSTFAVEYPEYWLYFWNPATRTRSEKLGYFRDYGNPLMGSFEFKFGHDNSTDMYKVVAFRLDGDLGNQASWRNEVRVFSLGDNSWRNIQSFPEFPIDWSHKLISHAHLNGTLNWVTLRNSFHWPFQWMYITVEQFVIVSLDLGTETCRQLLPPRGFDDMPRAIPTVGVLMDCLCFSHDFKGAELVIWQMKEFGVEESWTPFIRISYDNFPFSMISYQSLRDMDYPYDFRLLPLCLSENGETLILAYDVEDKVILYNWRDNRAEQTRITNGLFWSGADHYVESLVSTC